jgi:hypothetical protein
MFVFRRRAFIDPLALPMPGRFAPETQRPRAEMRDLHAFLREIFVG